MNQFKASVLTLLLVCTCGLFSNAQDDQHWSDLMNDSQVNFYDAQQAFNDYWEGKDVTDKYTIKGQGFKPFKRWEWFMEPRVYPTGERFDPTANHSAWEDLQKSSTNRVGGGGGVWTYFGNTDVPGSAGGAGRINMVRTDPASSGTYFACAPAGGLWKSTNSGSSWSLLNTDDLAAIGVSDVAIDPTNSDVMYIGTGDGDAGDTYALGVLKSTDGGLTWNSTGLNWTVQQTRRVNRLIIHPTSPGILLAATSNGLYRTTDGGVNWTQIESGTYKDVVFKPGNPSIVYAVRNSDNFHRSTDTGASFTQITAGLPTSGVSRIALTVTEANPNYVYILAGASDQGFFGYYRSTDSGLNFTQMSNSPNLLGWDVNGGGTGGQAWYDLATAADPNNADVVYVGGVNTWKSSDGGATWNCVGHWYGAGGTPYVHADIHGMYFIPGTTTLLIACDGGVFRTTNGGSSFTDVSNNLEVAQMYRLGVAQLDPDLVIQGWQDNGTNLKDGNVWDRVIGGDGFESIIDYSDNDIMYGALYYGNIRKSTNGGASFSTIVGSNGTGVDEGGDWLTPYILSPNNPSTMYVGKSVVYKSTDGGGSFSALGAIGGGNVDALAVAQSDENYIYASKSSTLYVSTDGASFSAVGGLPGLFITYIAVDPLDAQRVWVTLSGYTSGEKVYFSDNAGASWTNFSTGLPNIPANTIAYQAGTNDGLYVGTDVGVYYRDGSFGSWQQYSDGLPNVVVSELEIHYASNTIVGSTYGRGLWHAPLFSLPQVDGAVVSIDSPDGTLCDGTFDPEITIGNFGSDPVSQMLIEYGIDGSPLLTYEWTGVMITGQTQSVTLPSITEALGSHLFVANVLEVNNVVGDDNAINDSASGSFFISGNDNTPVLSLLTDCWSEESSWEVTDAFGNVVHAGAGYVDDTQYFIDLCLADGCYTFTMYDSYGDGLSSCNGGDFSMADEFGNPLLQMTNLNFGFSEAHDFCVPFVTISGCTNPFADNYDPLANTDDGSCVFSCTLIQLDLLTDCWASESSWELTDDLGNLLYSGSGYSNETQYLIDMCLDDGCYNFTMYDTYGDGLVSCAGGDFSIEDQFGNLLVEIINLNFGFSESHDFCITTTISGCTNPTACNYDPAATQDDGSCILPDGCTDPAACNYSAAALCDDGSCQLPDGCTNPVACNYNAAALCDDGSCILPDGCTDPTACNFNAAAVCDDGSCILPDGCTNASACNYNAAAQCDDGSCILPDGCTNPVACNYNASAQCDDGSCLLPDGCTDVTACNYDPAATCDDASCEYLSCTCPGDFNGDDVVDVQDLLFFLSQFGCLSDCTADMNGDDKVDTSDMLIFLGAYGSICN